VRNAAFSTLSAGGLTPKIRDFLMLAGAHTPKQEWVGEERPEILMKEIALYNRGFSSPVRYVFFRRVSELG
jgi:hypothetical protein